MYPPIHKRYKTEYTFDRLDMLWERYPQYHEMATFSSLEELLAEHDSYQADFAEYREEYISGGYDRFLVHLSWSDLPYRYATKQLLAAAPAFTSNPRVEAFMEQFCGINTDRKAGFLFPESYVSQFFVVTEVCKRAESFHPVRNLFPDEEKIHYLAVFDKQNISDVMLMYHLLSLHTGIDPVDQVAFILPIISQEK